MRVLLPFLVYLLLPASALAQTPLHHTPTSKGDRALVEQTISDVRGTLQELLASFATDLGVSDLFQENGGEDLKALLHEIEQLQQLAHRLQQQAETERRDELADRLRSISSKLHLVAEDVDELIETNADLQTGSRHGAFSTGQTDRDDHNAHEVHHDKDTGVWDWHGGHRFDFAGVGDAEFWPFRTQSVYRTLPALRYNRAEGFVLGVGLRPLAWDGYFQRSFYGQVGYAFALKDLRYTLGAETFLGQNRPEFAVKVGAAYYENTATNDAWKAGYTENSLAAFLFHNDFFDYYEIEGGTVYAAARMTPRIQVSAGFRSDAYRSLRQNTNWSLFRGDFRSNPLIEEGRIHALVFALDAGEVSGLYTVPRGAALQAEVEVADGLGGDHSFTRVQADGRVYLPTSYNTSVGLRVRGGYTSDDTPFQKLFTVGGVGTVRGYAQNEFFGTRAVVANAEFVLGDLHPFGDWFSGWQLIAFADAGWVNDLRNVFSVEDGVYAVGGAVGFDDRGLRLEVAWPVNDPLGRRSPAVWLRLEPNF